MIFMASGGVTIIISFSRVRRRQVRRLSFGWRSRMIDCASPANESNFEVIRKVRLLSKVVNWNWPCSLVMMIPSRVGWARIRFNVASSFGKRSKSNRNEIYAEFIDGDRIVLNALSMDCRSSTEALWANKCRRDKEKKKVVSSTQKSVDMSSNLSSNDAHFSLSLSLHWEKGKGTVREISVCHSQTISSPIEKRRESARGTSNNQWEKRMKEK